VSVTYELKSPIFCCLSQLTYGARVQAKAVDCGASFSFPMVEGRRVSLCSTGQQYSSRNNTCWEASGKFRGFQNSISFF